jgi:ABC-type antimicrobial peptide transport system permease subunit
MKMPQTPDWVDSLIENLAPQRFREEIMGDLHEFYIQDIEVNGLKSARRKYVLNGLGFLAKSFFWKKSSHSNSLIMLSSYFKMATRSLMAYKGTAIINILGLVIGIASAIVILTVIRFELGFDKFHSNIDRIYRVVRVSGDDMSEFRTGVSYPVPNAIKEEISSLEMVTSVEYFGGAQVEIMSADGTSIKKFGEGAGFVLAEPSFFKVLDFKGTNFKWLNGNPEKALTEPFSIVLTRALAKKYFGDGNALGETLKLERQIDCKVTGVIEDLPNNTDFPFKALVSYSTLKRLSSEEQLNNWFSVNDTHQTYVLLRPGVTEEEMEEKIAKVHAAHTPKELSDSRHYLLQKLSDMHYDARFGTFSGRTISRDTILGLSLVAIFLLLTASINYINLSTAQSTLRAKEIGLRKVMGSNRKNVVAQHLTETFLIVLLASVIALGLSEGLLFYFQSLLNITKTQYNFTDPFILLALAAIIILVTLLAGSYPSLVLSRFNPVTALKNKFSTEQFSGFSLRKVLVVLQFTITQMLVVGTFIVVSQMDYFRNIDMGFNKEGIVTTRIPNQDPGVLQVMEDKLRAQAFVSDVSFSFTLPSGVNRNHSYQDIGLPQADAMKDYHVFEYVAIDDSFLDLYDIKLAAGRNLTIQDSAGNILINKTLMKNLGFSNHEEVLGKQLKMSGNRLVTVVGVVEDYFSNSLKEGVDNIVMLMNPSNYSIASIKLDVKDGKSSLPEAVEKVEKIWRESFPEFIFSYEFMDDNVAAFYKQEQKYADLFKMFSLIFLLIGTLGLYGLITFIVSRKGKEVAIRKVLGATISNILVMFSKEYLLLIMISFLLAMPITYYAVDSWLSNFHNHIELKWYLFLIPGLLVLFIALSVIITKSIRAATTNPVDKLKYE